MKNIIFEIGDWSSDGHGYSAEFLVRINKELNELRQVHLKENEFIGSLCSSYEDNQIKLSKLFLFLKKYMDEKKAKEELKILIQNIDVKVLDLNDIDEKCIEDIENVSFNDEDEQVLDIYSQTTMLEIWLKLLKVIEPSFEYKIISKPMSHSYIKYKGYPEIVDGKFHYYGYIGGNHIDTPGYGTWSFDDNEFYHGD